MPDRLPSKVRVSRPQPTSNHLPRYLYFVNYLKMAGLAALAAIGALVVGEHPRDTPTEKCQ